MKFRLSSGTVAILVLSTVVTLAIANSGPVVAGVSVPQPTQSIDPGTGP